ncbi:MAG: DUF4258 domain-containing protein [Candidatus Heimdallarchaeota archaeon]|nr:DUF4258 domain-containing protein [Candidatus Heimdallarchaeota archaeon]
MIKLTNHVIERLKQRGISPIEVLSISVKEFLEHNKEDQASSFLIKERKKSNLKVIYKIIEDEIIIITCFVVKS